MTFDDRTHREALNLSESWARFSQCGTYRYVLSREWRNGLPRVAFVMLNPSTADERVNDPTVQRCEVRARRHGFGGFVVVNIFALRSTDPRALYGHADPVGPANDAQIVEQSKLCQLVVCGWGGHGMLHGRGAQVAHLLWRAGVRPHALVINADGTPKHPLYVPYRIEPTPMGIR